jgi:multisubunit Na+/H+ antiporter MnhG subunit
MFFHFRALVYSALFLIILELIAYDDQRIFWLTLLLIGVTLWGIKKILKRFIFSAIPVIFAVSATAMLYLIDSMIEKHIFIVFGSFLYYLSLLGIFRLKNAPQDQTARGMIAASASASLFFFYSAVYGIYLNFSIALWILMLIFLLVTTLVSYEYFSIINPNKKEVQNYSLILGMLMAEVAWMINFWPFGYLTTGVVTLIFYYIFWDLTQSHFLNTLSQKRLVANLVFFGVIIGLILTTSRWMPVV